MLQGSHNLKDQFNLQAKDKTFRKRRRIIEYIKFRNTLPEISLDVNIGTSPRLLADQKHFTYSTVNTFKNTAKESLWKEEMNKNKKSHKKGKWTEIRKLKKGKMKKKQGYKGERGTFPFKKY